MEGTSDKLAGKNPEQHYMLYFLLLLQPFSVYFKKIINKAPLLTCRNCNQLIHGVMEGTDFWTALICWYSRPCIIKESSKISTVACFFWQRTCINTEAIFHNDLIFENYCSMAFWFSLSWKGQKVNQIFIFARIAKYWHSVIMMMINLDFQLVWWLGRSLKLHWGLYV